MLTNIKAPKNGYAYVYVSNESDEMVYFDNLQVSHQRGRIIEENHYYAYGLRISSISSRKLAHANDGRIVNNYLFQGAYSELDEDIGWNDFALRSYDPQTGRWAQADPFNQFASPYSGMGSNPVNLIDPSGGIVIPLCPGVSNLAIALANVGYAANAMLAGIQNLVSAVQVGVTITNIAASTGNTVINIVQMGETSNMINNSILTNQVGVGNAPQSGGGWMVGNDPPGSDPPGSDTNEEGAWVDYIQTGLDVVGIFDPTGIADGVNGFIYLGRGKWSDAGISALGIIPFIGDLGKIGRLGGKLTKNAAKTIKALPSLDATGKVHGTLPRVQDLGKYSKEELQILLKELRQSVQKRIEVTSKMGRDKGHGQRQSAEQDLIKSLEKYLGQ